MASRTAEQRRSCGLGVPEQPARDANDPDRLMPESELVEPVELRPGCLADVRSGPRLAYLPAGREVDDRIVELHPPRGIASDAVDIGREMQRANGKPRLLQKL